MSSFNDIGIDATKLDWKRISHLLKIGLFASCLTMASDMILGWGTKNPEYTGMRNFLSLYDSISDGRIFWSSLLSFIGIPIEGLCYFAIYRMIAAFSNKYAHIFRSGILVYIAFAGCGVHVQCLATIFVYKYVMSISPETAVDTAVRFGAFFLLPGLIVFCIFFFVQTIAQIIAFAKGLTPYPKWCWIFCTLIGMLMARILKLFGNIPIINALTAGWISIGNIWMFGGLLVMMNKAIKLNQKNEKK